MSAGYVDRTIPFNASDRNFDAQINNVPKRAFFGGFPCRRYVFSKQHAAPLPGKERQRIPSRRRIERFESSREQHSTCGSKSRSTKTQPPNPRQSPNHSSKRDASGLDRALLSADVFRCLCLHRVALRMRAGGTSEISR